MQSTYILSVPGNVVAGIGSIHKLAGIVSGLNARRVAVMTDSGVLKSGTPEMVAAILKEVCNQVDLICDIPPEPEDRQVLEIYARAKEISPDAIVAVGGGSVMDTSKMVSVLLTNPKYAADLTDKTMIHMPGVPTVMVPTSSGTGSEATPNSIVVIPEKKLKVGVVHPYFLPQHVILDPQLTRSLPMSVTASTGLDAFCHCIETFISRKCNPFCETFALKGLSLIARYLRRAYTDGNDMEAREGMALAAFYGGVAITSSSTVAVHALSYPLGGSYRIPHGISNAILLPSVMAYNMDAIPDKVNAIAEAIGVPTAGKSTKEIGDGIVSEIYSLAGDLAIPNDLLSYGITEKDLDFLTDSAAEVHRLLDQNPKTMSKDDIRGIYRKLIEP